MRMLSPAQGTHIYRTEPCVCVCLFVCVCLSNHSSNRPARSFFRSLSLSLYQLFTFFMLPSSCRARCMSKLLKSRWGSWPMPLRRHSNSALSK